MLKTMRDVLLTAVISVRELGMDHAVCADWMNSQYGTQYTAHDIEQMTSAPSRKRHVRHLVHGLAERNYSAQKIAQILGISPPNVYYHLRQELKYPYASQIVYEHAGALKPLFEPVYKEWFERCKTNYLMKHGQ